MPQSILYDNTRIVVAKILGDGQCRRTQAFAELQSYYLFEDKFGHPAKGKVEGLVSIFALRFCRDF
ncbi:transposase, IS21 family domain protein [Collimonas fungivorans]|uniref:Transposase, IS21 family domain protein n=1 Tax=Collimonas fungivorans TaxID=158899 RepID=A0A127P6C2_9BURK|nr:transposase, IS21 family domain protein [Collimonas fungivorans]